MWYKQEGELVPFTAWPWMWTTTHLAKPYFKHHFRTVYGAFDKDYGRFYWDIDAMNALAAFVYKEYGDNIDKIYVSFTKKAKELEKVYLETFEDDFGTYSHQKWCAFYWEVWKKYTAMWSMSLFIDSFDPGSDQEEIKRIAEEKKLTKEEVAVLTTPEERSYGNERLFDFLSIVRQLREEGYREKDVDSLLSHPLLKQHLRKFDYYQCSYAHFKPITQEQLKNELKLYLKNTEKREKEYTELSIYSQIRKEKINRLLQKHHLKKNPLRFFQRLTYWREHRKKANMQGAYVFHRLLIALSTKTGIPKKYLDYLQYDEIERLLEGKITQKMLKERYDKTIMIMVESERYTILVGEKALKQRKEYDLLIQEKSSSGQIRGYIACSGKAQGTVKIIMKRDDFKKFKDGDILVAGMTRPEHVPLMRKAAAIVTNEGGITCHAAIVSRELRKPCIIGTKVATEVLRDDDVVEVDANHGIIRKIR